MRVKPGDNLKWKHPPKPDLIDLHPASIVECHVEGEWDISNQRTMTYVLKNHTYISLLIEHISD